MSPKTPRQLRIAYVSFEDPADESSVGAKMSSQAAVWRQMNHNVMHVSLRPHLKISEPDTGVVYPVSSVLRARSPLMAAALSHRNIRSALERYIPDIIYMRQTLWWPGLYSVLSGFVVVEEINSDLDAELTLLGRSKVIKMLMRQIGARSNSNVYAGHVCVTNELLRCVPARASKAVVIANGADFPEAPPPRRLANKELVMVSSKDQPWQGFEELFLLAKHMPEYTFNVVGPIERMCAPTNIVFHGRLSREKLSCLYGKALAGIGSLALHKKNMKEACPLKTREYAAHCLPTICSYIDTDLDGAAYNLNIGNLRQRTTEKVQLINAFLDEWSARPYPYEDARAKLSNAIKEKQRISFFREVINSAASTY